MREFLERLGVDARAGLPLVSWCVLSTVFALSGPFGSYDSLGFSQRLLFWSAVTAAATLVGLTLRGALMRHAGLHDSRLRIFFTALCNTVILSWPLQALTTQITLPTTRPGLFEVALFLFATSLATAAFHGSVASAPAQTEADPEPDPAPEVTVPDAAPPYPRIVQRLEPGMQGRLVSMTVRDHYVDVTTTAGRSSLLMRFADAMAEAAEEPGAQVHRSHWVAWWAVQRAEKSGGKLLLHVQDADPIPVSRTYRAMVEARGRA